MIFHVVQVHYSRTRLSPSASQIALQTNSPFVSSRSTSPVYNLAFAFPGPDHSPFATSEALRRTFGTNLAIVTCSHRQL